MRAMSAATQPEQLPKAWELCDPMDTPDVSTTYTLYAKGTGGTKTAAVRVTVIAPSPLPRGPSGPSDDFDFESIEPPY
jgi:hypothetical protein